VSAPSSPSSDATTGLEGVRGYPSSDRSGQDGSGDLSVLLLPLVHAIRESVETDEEIADAVACAVERAGWRRVTEDPGQTALDEAYALGEAEAEGRLLALRGGA
jgi:hypothetical protein